MMPAARVLERIAPLPFGLSVWQTLRKMKDLTRKASVDPRTVQLAKDVSRNVPPGDLPGYASAILEYTRGAFTWFPDPYNTELLTDPLRQVEEVIAQGYVQNDCDCSTMFTAALARATGMRTRFVTMPGPDGGPVSHVRSMAFTGRGWFSFDLSAPSLVPTSASAFMEVQ